MQRASPTLQRSIRVVTVITPATLYESLIPVQSDGGPRGIYRPKGYDITNPASRKDVEDKFVALTTRAGIIDQHRAKAIMDLVDRIEMVENIDTLTELLVG